MRPTLAYTAMLRLSPRQNCLQAVSRDPADYAAGVCNAPVMNWVSQLRFDGATFFDPAPRLPATVHQLPVGPESTLAGPDWLATTQAQQKLRSGTRSRDKSRPPPPPSPPGRQVSSINVQEESRVAGACYMDPDAAEPVRHSAAEAQLQSQPDEERREMLAA